MKFTIFGANGGIGRLIVTRALDAEYEVNAYVRNPSKLGIAHKNLTLVTGQLGDHARIKEVIAGCDGVVSALGCPMKWNYEGAAILDGHKNIIRAVQELKVFRLISLATPSVKFGKDARSMVTVLPGILAGIMFRKAKQEIIAVANAITNSDLDWTIVRILAPKNTPYAGAAKVSFGNKKINFSISSEDIAEFMLSQMISKTYSHSMPIIGN